MKFGIPENSLQMIIEGFSRFNSISEAWFYGSRALGNYKTGSDIDIAIKGKNITFDEVIKLSSLLNEEFPLPYFFDITHYDKLDNNELRKHIDEVGKLVYSTNIKV
jgi:predicted nucleotidyltransferase